MKKKASILKRKAPTRRPPAPTRRTVRLSRALPAPAPAAAAATATSEGLGAALPLSVGLMLGGMAYHLSIASLRTQAWVPVFAVACLALWGLDRARGRKAGA